MILMLAKLEWLAVAPPSNRYEESVMKVLCSHVNTRHTYQILIFAMDTMMLEIYIPMGNIGT